MPLQKERMLLSLAMELAAAKEPLTAVEALGRYLQNRFEPENMEHFSVDKAPALPENGEVYGGDKKQSYFLLDLTEPTLFALQDVRGEEPSAHELKTIVEAARIFRERYAQMKELKGLTYTDDLTGLYNQRYLELILDRELSLAKRNDTPFSVLFLDLDHFKSINDTHGHLIGSRLLYEVGQEIKKTLRESDITFRYGGDEFVMVLAHTNLPDAIMVAERIRQQIEKKRFLAREGLEIRLTASIGVAAVPEHATTKKQILEAADRALYGVKKAVRNKVIAATVQVESEKKSGSDT